MALALAISMAAGGANAQGRSGFKAEDLIEATEPTVVCESADVLLDAWQAANRGEQTRVAAYLDKKRCVLAGPGDRLRVMSVRLDPVLEVVPPSTTSAENGLFTAAKAFKKVRK